MFDITAIYCAETTKAPQTYLLPPLTGFITIPTPTTTQGPCKKDSGWWPPYWIWYLILNPYYYLMGSVPPVGQPCPPGPLQKPEGYGPQPGPK